MDKRAIIGIALSILVLVVYQQFISWYYGVPPEGQAPVAEKNGAEKFAAPRQPSPAPSASAPTAQPIPAPVAAAQAAKEITVETDNYVAVFTTRGARLKSFKLTRFRSSVDEKSPPFEIIQTAPGVPLPLGVRWQTPTPFEDNELVYSHQGNDLKLTGADKATLGFQGQTSGGAVITKSFAFSGAAYPIQLEVSVKVNDGVAPTPELLLTHKSDSSVPNPHAPFEGFIALVDNKIQREPPADAAQAHEYAGDVAWGGFGHTYFFFAVLPENGAQHKLTLGQDGPSLTAAIGGAAGGGPHTPFIGPEDLHIFRA